MMCRYTKYNVLLKYLQVLLVNHTSVELEKNQLKKRRIKIKKHTGWLNSRMQTEESQ